MEDEKRRSERFTQGLPVRLTLRSSPEGPSIAGPIAGNLTNISASGAGINLTSIFIDNHHLFYAPQDSPEHVLFLDLIQPDKTDNFISLPVQPLWFDRIQTATENSFIMGVEFVLEKDDVKFKQFIQMIQEKQQNGGNWLRNLVERIVGEWKEKKDFSDN